MYRKCLVWALLISAGACAVVAQSSAPSLAPKSGAQNSTQTPSQLQCTVTYKDVIVGNTLEPGLNLHVSSPFPGRLTISESSSVTSGLRATATITSQGGTATIIAAALISGNKITVDISGDLPGYVAAGNRNHFAIGMAAALACISALAPFVWGRSVKTGALAACVVVLAAIMAPVIVEGQSSSCSVGINVNIVVPVGYKFGDITLTPPMAFNPTLGPSAPVPPSVAPAPKAPTPSPPPAPAPIAASGTPTFSIVNPAEDSTTILNNPFTGLYKWLGNPIYTAYPYRDVYYRWAWRDIEPTEGNYVWTNFDAAITEATNNNGKFAFRIMALDTWWAGQGTGVNHQRNVPDYLATTSYGFYCSALSVWVPDWNSDRVLTRMEALMTAIGDRYRNSPRIAWVDVGLYGNYGEWHNAEIRDAGCYAGRTEGTAANKRRILNAVMNNFPNQFLALNANDEDAVCWWANDVTVGLRWDTVASPGGGGWDSHWYGDFYKEAWRTGPYIGEFATSTDFASVGLSDVMVVGVTTVGNGNTPESDKAALADFVRVTGARLTMTAVNFTSPVRPGGCFIATVTMKNTGTARIYENWTFKIQFRNTGTTTVAWQTTGIIELKNVLPTRVGPATWTESNNFAISSSLSAGNYDVVIVVADSNSVRPNLLLANTGRAGDGSIKIGTVTVAANAPAVASCSTRSLSYVHPRKAIGANTFNDHPVGRIFTDMYFPGWYDVPNGATQTVVSSPTWGGSSKAISFTTTNAYGLWAIQFKCTVNMAGYGYFHFRARATAATGTLFMYIYKTPWGSPNPTQVTAQAPSTTSWTTYNIPLSSFTNINGFIDQVAIGAYNSGVTVYVDDVSFTDSPIN